MDIFTPEKRHAIMSNIRSRDTRPEQLVRKYLFSRGYRFRKNVKGLPGTPDIVMRKYRTVIFVHGCFWHGHSCRKREPRTRTQFWEEKIGRNRERDARNKADLLKMGWNVLTVWECQLRPAVRRQTLLEIESCLNRAYLQDLRMRVSEGKHRTKKRTFRPEADTSEAAEPDSGYGYAGAEEKESRGR